MLYMRGECPTVEGNTKEDAKIYDTTPKRRDHASKAKKATQASVVTNDKPIQTETKSREKM